MKGTIVLVHFPFTDLSSTKLRPALVIHSGADDVIVAFISSRVPSRKTDYCVLIAEDDPAFAQTGLKMASVIRFDKIATLSRDLVEGGIGRISPRIADECNVVIPRFLRL